MHTLHSLEALCSILLHLGNLQTGLQHLCNGLQAQFFRPNRFILVRQRSITNTNIPQEIAGKFIC